MKKLLFIFLFILLTKIGLSCDIENLSNEDNLDSWLGNKSYFSETYKKGKCALEKALTNIPLEQKVVIANIIAKSYKKSMDDNKDILMYNY